VDQLIDRLMGQSIDRRYIAGYSGEVAFPVICEVHGGRALEYFCETDQVPICSQCALLGDHQGHEITTADDKVARSLTLTFLNFINIVYVVFMAVDFDD